MGDDRNSLKRALSSNFGLSEDYDEFGWFNPPLSKDKVEWGFRHSQIAELLTPHDEDWNDST
jgi:hypothetical protein